MEREKTRGELIAERLEKEADEMMKRINDSQTESEPEAKGLAIPEAEGEDTPEEVVEDAETSPDESQETEETSDQIEEIQEDDSESEDDDKSLSAQQWEERYKNAQARMTKATQKEKELEAKIAEMSNKITAMESMKSESKVEKQIEEVGVDLSQIAKDYPEIVEPLQKYVDSRIALVNQKLQQTTSEVLKSQQEEADRIHQGKISEAHPDWQSVAATEDFNLWLDRQSNMWRIAAKEGDAEDVISLLSKYKTDMGLVSKTVSKAELVEKAKQNVEPSLSKARKQNLGSSKKVWTAQEIGKLSDKQFAKLEKEIDLAYAEGRVKPK